MSYHHIPSSHLISHDIPYEVERALCRTWRNHQSVKELHLRSAFNQSFCLRQRMLHFMQNLSYYMMAEVKIHGMGIMV